MTQMNKHIIKLACLSVFYFFVCLIMAFIGLFVVAYGVQKPRKYEDTKKPFTDSRQLPGEHTFTRLSHDWMLWWDNLYDGITGDRRGWWNTYCINTFKCNAESKLAMWIWAAYRNSCNYFSRNIVGMDVSKYSVTLLAGQEIADEDHPGWHFLLATHKETGKQRYYFGWFKLIGSNHYAYTKFGWKIKLSHNSINDFSTEADKWKGFTCRLSPWKVN